VTATPFVLQEPAGAETAPAAPAPVEPSATASRTGLAQPPRTLERLAQLVIMLVIGTAAGTGSFTHVHDVAAAHGQAGWLAWSDAVVLELMSIAAGPELRRRKRAHTTLGFPAAVMGRTGPDRRRPRHDQAGRKTTRTAKATSTTTTPASARALQRRRRAVRSRGSRAREGRVRVARAPHPWAGGSARPHRAAGSGSEEDHRGGQAGREVPAPPPTRT